MIIDKRQQAPPPLRNEHRLEDAKALDLRETALRLGLTLGKGGKMMFCPAGHGRGPGRGTPSVSLFRGDDGDAWNCQACDAGGSVLDLVMVARDLELPAAIDLLLGESIPLPPDRPKLETLDAQVEVSLSVRSAAVAAFLEPLSLTETGREWLLSRGLDPAIAAAAGVVDTTEHLSEAFVAAVAAVGQDDAVALGLGKLRDGVARCSWPGGWLLWPYLNGKGVPLTMQGRALDPNAQLRWRHLRGGVPAPWGLDDLRCGRIWIVEGCTDALSIRQRGESAIGLSRNGLSQDHVDRMAKLIGKRPVIVALDSDKAGRDGQPLTAARLTAAGCSVDVVDWGEHEGDWCDWWAACAGDDRWPTIDEGEQPDVFDPPLFDRGDEVELGLHLAGRLGGAERAVYDEDVLWRLRGRLWHMQPELALERMAQDYSGEWRLGPKDKPNVPIKLSARACGGIVHVSKTALSRDQFFSEAPIGAAFAGMFARVNGRKVVIEPLTPEHRVRANAVTPWDLSILGTDVPVFSRVLSETWDGCADLGQRVRYLFEWLGLALVGLATAHKASPLLIGEADTGKSVILGAIASCFPKSSHRSIPLQSMSREYSRAMLVGARINFVNELPARDILDGEAAKALMGGVDVEARHPMGRPFTLRSRCAHIFAANSLPPSLDQALQRRLVLLDCPNVVPLDQQDPDLATKLCAESPAIARIALRSLEDVLERGRILTPSSSDDLAGEWVTSSDPVAAWSKECLRVSEKKTLSSVLYKEYRTWSVDNGHTRPLSKISWGKRMRRLGFESTHSNGSWWFAETVSPAESEAEERWGMRGGGD